MFMKKRLSVDELNAAVADGSIGELIRVAEARQCKVLSGTADEICARGDIRLVLISGGSAAGKTTTAKRLATQLRVNGKDALHLSTDDYFVGDALNPRDADGNLDYEHVDCVDRTRLVADIRALCAGEIVPVRRFDFVAHKPCYTDRFHTLGEGGIVLLEGLHALNPLLTQGFERARTFRLFVEPTPSLEIAPGETLRSDEARFVRRLVRDNQFRKLSPLETLSLWPRVLRGEEKWIDPFRNEADEVFDSYLVYEMAVLKPYVGGLLERIRFEKGDDAGIVRFLDVLSRVSLAPTDLVPGDSIIRETIGGSQLEY